MRHRNLAAVAVFTVATYFAATGAWPWQRLADAPASLAVADSAPIAPTHRQLVDTLHSGETLSELLERHQMVGINLASLTDALNPRRLRAGLIFDFRRPVTDSVPDRVTVRTGPEQRLLFTRVADNWSAGVDSISWHPEIVRADGDIQNSLYEALDRQIPDSVLDDRQRINLAWALSDVFAWEVDFSRDIRAGDHFTVVLERLVSDEGEVRFGRVLASDLSVDARHYTAFHFAGTDGSSFYDKDGNSLRRAFLRAPVEFRRISSGFTNARFHPVLGYTRKHEGTDFAAATGTPVMASGDGTVIRAGRAGGYGNLIEIRHRNGITTRYGHLSRILTHKGARVHQGEVIGKVGQTGLATGPHLHYEFRVNGIAKDSRRVELGNGAPVASAQRSAFQRERDRLSAILYDGPAPPIQIMAAVTS
jgi:murein DD-endopeptidase MepM/ murein hydrolase activator NlpD